MWGPPVINWFINPSNYSYLRTINHSYWSYVHQLSYRKRGPHFVEIDGLHIKNGDFPWLC